VNKINATSKYKKMQRMIIGKSYNLGREQSRCFSRPSDKSETSFLGRLEEGQDKVRYCSNSLLLFWQGTREGEVSSLVGGE
jgi:hypothetical protein